MPQRPYDPTHATPLHLSVDAQLPATHPIRFIAMVVRELPAEDRAALGLTEAPKQRGAPNYAPELLLAVWLAGFTFGIRTTRKLEAACRYDLAFIWLTGNQHPDHHTLWQFYARHRPQMQRVLKQTVRIAIEAQLLDLRLQGIDGTKLLANAAVERSMTAQDLAELEQRLASELERMESQHQGDDEPPVPPMPPGLANPAVLRQRVQQARAQVAATEQAGKVNLTDPQARIMKTRQGLRPAYNAQAVVVALEPQRSGRSGRIIVAAEVTTEADDHAQLLPMLAAARAQGARAAVTVADAGYHSGANLAAGAAQGMVVVIPEPCPRSQPVPLSAFTYQPETDTYQCPQGVQLTRRTNQRTDGRVTYRADGGRCHSCPLRSACLGTNRGGRVVLVGPHDTQLRQHRTWMATAQANAILHQRAGLIEGGFGTIKEQFGGRRVWLRGVDKVTCEWRLLAIGANLRTLAKVWALRAVDRGPTLAATTLLAA